MRLASVILWRLSDGPLSYAGIVRLIQHRRPRVGVDAIDQAICRLSRLNFIEHFGGKWRIARAPR